MNRVLFLCFCVLPIIYAQSFCAQTTYVSTMNDAYTFQGAINNPITAGKVHCFYVSPDVGVGYQVDSMTLNITRKLTGDEYIEVYGYFYPEADNLLLTILPINNSDYHLAAVAGGYALVGVAGISNGA